LAAAFVVTISIVARAAEILGGSSSIVLGRCGLILSGDFRLVVARVIANTIVGRASMAVRNCGKVRLAVIG